VTAGTILHGAKKPLRDWLLAIWWFSGSQFDSSAKELQRLLAISCYQTAWTWLQKLRLAMGKADRGRCRGVVEIGCNTIAPARERKERALVLTAAEVVLSMGLTGRIRMRHIFELDHPTLFQFVHESVQAASSILAPEDPCFDGLAEATSCYVARFPSTSPQRIKELNDSFEACLHYVHRGGSQESTCKATSMSFAFAATRPCCLTMKRYSEPCWLVFSAKPLVLPITLPQRGPAHEQQCPDRPAPADHHRDCDCRL
jgi:hypothetical protein